ncbi:MAG: hypothetical protein WBQ31_23155, partial [Candidatus Acidiferrales bacterium]
MRLHSKLGKNSNSRPVLSSCLCAALVVAVLVAISAAAVSADPENNSAAKVTLQSGWRLQSSCQFSATGDQISATGFKTDGWHSTDVPSTVVAALVADKTYP